MADIETTSPSMDAARAKLAETVREWGYFREMADMRPLMQGRRVLEIGMGGGPFSVAAIEAAGAASYVGVDPTIGTRTMLDLRGMTDPTVPRFHEFPYTPAEMMAIYPNIKLYPNLLEEVTDEVRAQKVDFAYMSSVTEHLERLPEIFETIWETLVPGGSLWFGHHGYHSWTGHHQNPRTVKAWDRADPAHNAVVDWKHLEPDHFCYNESNYNRVRLADFRTLVEKFYVIDIWQVVYDAVERMTPEIRQRWKKYTLDELLGRTVRVLCTRRDRPLDTDLSGLPFFHPPEDYLADADHMSDPDPGVTLAGSLFFYAPDRVASHTTNNTAGDRVFALLQPGDQIRLCKNFQLHDFTVLAANFPEGSSAHLILDPPLESDDFDSHRTDWMIIAIYTDDTGSGRRWRRIAG